MTSDANALVDTGFLVALCDRQDQWHEWAVACARDLRGPWLTCEGCIVELDHLLGFVRPPQSFQIFELLASGALQSRHLLPEELTKVRSEIMRYKDRRVDFVDACLIILSDHFPMLPLVTTDTGDFRVYFRGRGARQVLTPEK